MIFNAYLEFPLSKCIPGIFWLLKYDQEKSYGTLKFEDSMMQNMGWACPKLGHILMAYISLANRHIELKFLMKLYHIISKNWYENHDNQRG